MPEICLRVARFGVSSNRDTKTLFPRGVVSSLWSHAPGDWIGFKED